MRQVVAVTPTGDRPETLELCGFYVRRQVRQPDRWIVIDDGRTPARAPKGAELHRREPQPDDPPHTLVKNLQLAMDLVEPDDLIVMFEDDDWYSPYYIATIVFALLEHDLAGVGGTYYYYYPDALLWDVGNDDHCSLCATGFRARVMQGMKWPDNYSVDLAIWKEDCRKKFISNWPPQVIGMKGLPGRQGQSSGHDRTRKGYKPDLGRVWLHGIIGRDIEHYKRMMP